MDRSLAILKDEVIKYALDNKTTILNTKFLVKDLGIDSNEAVIICQELESDGLISRFEKKQRPFARYDAFEIVPKGELFASGADSFLKKYEADLAESNRQKDNQEIGDAKLRWDAKLSKWQVRTFWPMMVGGFIAGTFALALELEGRYSKWQEEQSEQSQLEQLETSTNSIDTPKQDEQYLHADTLK